MRDSHIGLGPQGHRMETVTHSNLVTAQRKASMERRGAARGGAAPMAAMTEVRVAWQALLGPAPLPPNLLEQLLLLSNVRHAKTGQLVHSRSDIASGLVLLVKGAVGLGVLTPPAALRIERSLHGPQWLDLTSAWLNGSPSLDAVALGDVLVVNVARSAYQTLMERQPELARRTIVCLAAAAHAATGMTHELMHKDAQARLATWLLQRCGGDAVAPTIVLHERKRDIASQLAVTPETLSRLLKQFSDDGLLQVHGYTIAVLDLPALKARAETGSTDQP